MKSIFCLSGLGADRRVFQNLRIPGFEMVFIDWIAPLKGESMEHYALRLSIQIKDKNPILLGVSFGGMMALELAKLFDTEMVFLISSAKRKEELHGLFQWVMKRNLVRFIPRPLLGRSNFVLEYLFGITDSKEQQLLADIIADTDIAFLYWSLNAMYRWDNKFRPGHMVEIHGTADKLIPYRNDIPISNTIEAGGHLMILNKAERISNIIHDYLRSNNS